MPDAPAIVDLTGDDDDGTYADPTAAELAAADTDGGPASPLGDLEAELTAELTAEPIRVDVKGRDGWRACYRKDFTGKDVRKWRNQSKLRGDDVDEVKLAGLVVSFTLIGLEKDGTPVSDPEVGGPLTMSSAWLQRTYATGSAIDTARRFFGGDGYLCGQANAVLEEAGWGGSANVSDPS